jgi:hypothetical protein
MNNDVCYTHRHHSIDHRWTSLGSKAAPKETSYDACPNHPYWRDRADKAVTALVPLTTQDQIEEMIDGLPSEAFRSLQTYAIALETLLKEKENSLLPSGLELER